ncbi:MAG: DUF1015 domain-containing protein [Lachnospiraceae bacterium]|nr:DUF1015 domain-containing protein [Lachnospiraceae bacterium]
MENWSVIACDQFTSQPEYWRAVRKRVGEDVSTLHLVFPEAELGAPDCGGEERIRQINRTMEQYLQQNRFREYPDSYIYVERTLLNGTVRRGIIGAIDLEAYDYQPDSSADIRATERTVIERIPPRKKIRENAPIELPHVLLLANDEKRMLIEPLTGQKDRLQKLYDFELMENGGHVAGWLVSGEDREAFDRRLEQYAAEIPEAYADLTGASLLFAVGDGNHSLATAKTCYEELKSSNPNLDFSSHPARFALVELENIHDEAQQFEPIHRILKSVDPDALLHAVRTSLGAERPENGYPVVWHAQGRCGTLYLDRTKGQLPVGILQPFLDDYLRENGGEIDYIHGEEVLLGLTKEAGSIGFLLPAIEKNQLFRGLVADGVLPRKTFSMGHACEKRYYLEARRIR